MDLYLVRHTNVAIGPGICYGQSDIDVADTFDEESRQVRSKLPVSAEDAVFYSSPMKRCHRLAVKLAPKKVYFDERLKELDFGEWELKKWDEIKATELQKWMDDFVHVPCPGGESYMELSERVLQWREELIGQPHESVVVITHAGVIRCLLSHLLEIPYRNSFRLVLGKGSITAVSIHDRSCSVKYINR